MTADAWTLSGFGDEIDPDPAVQLAVLQALGARHIEVRSAWDTNIVDMTTTQLDRLAAILNERGMARVRDRVADRQGRRRRPTTAASSTRLGRAIAAAHRLGSPLHPDLLVLPRRTACAVEAIRDDVLHRMRAFADLAARERRGAGAREREGHLRRRAGPGARPDRVGRLRRAAGGLGQRELRPGRRRGRSTTGTRCSGRTSNTCRSRTRSAGHRRGRAGRRGRRRAAGDGDRAARRRLHRIRLPRTAPRRSSTASAASPARPRSAGPRARSPALTTSIGVQLA